MGDFQSLQVKTGLPWCILALRVQAQAPGLHLLSTSCMPGTVLFRCREPHGAPGGRCPHPHFMGEVPEVTRLIVGARVRQLPSFALSHCAGPFSGSKVQGCLPWCLWSPAPGATGAPVEQENGGALDSALNCSLRGPWLCPTRSPGRSGVSAWGGTRGAGFGFHHSAPDAGAVRPLLDALQKAGPRGAWKGGQPCGPSPGPGV